MTIAHLHQRFKYWCNAKACTCFFDSWLGTYIGDICADHDEDYVNQFRSKEKADERLALRVYNRVPWYKGSLLVSLIMWAGVRTGGYIASWNSLKK